MTPAIKILQKEKIDVEIREYESDEQSSGYGMQAADALDQDPHQVFKTLLAVIDGNVRKPVVAVIPVAHQLDLKKLASHFGGRKSAMADPAIAQRATGYIVGGISPLGQKQKLQCAIDQSALNFEILFISGGKRGLQLAVNPHDLIQVIGASVVDLAR